MKRRGFNCPGCGGPVEFKTGSAPVTVCDFCQSVVARDDKKLEDYGKVADVGETSSGLRIGLTGHFNHRHFTITGRVRYQHPAGGVWDEWYLLFPGEKWGWLAEAQGKFHLTFARTLNQGITLPAFESLTVGSIVRLGKSEFRVREKGTATAIAADGEIPWAMKPNSEHSFADLDGLDGSFATFEYGPPQPTAYTGNQVKLADLGIDVSNAHPDAGIIKVASVQLNCPYCAGPLTLRAPDKSERITCPQCDRLLDIKEGKLSVFETLKKRKVEPVIPLGSEGTIAGVKYTVIGFMERYATYEGRRYPWDEYLLYEPTAGFRWLVCNQKHWSFVETIPSTLSDVSDRVSFNGRSFRLYDRGTAFVHYVMGEFYWQVRVGESAQTSDYIAPPYMLSFERSFTTRSEELNLSLGVYMDVAEVEKVFGLKELPRPWGVSPNSPKPDVGIGVFVLWGVFILYLLLVNARYYTGQTTTGSDVWLMFYAMLTISVPPALILFYMHNVEVQRWKDSDYSPYASAED